LTRTGKSDRPRGPTGRAESLTLGQPKVRSCQRTWRRIRTQSLRDRGLPPKQCLSVVVTNIDEDTKFLCFPRSHYELVKLHRSPEAILNVERVHECLLRVTAGTGFMSAFTDYKPGRREFSNESMSIDKMKKIFSKEVGDFPNICLLYL